MKDGFPEFEMNSTDLGRVGEMLTAMTLQALGFSTALVNLPGVDVVAIYNGRPVTFEVKSRKSPTPRHSGDVLEYSFRCNSQINADWIAYVALDSGMIIFESGNCAVSHRHIRADQFTVQRCHESMVVLMDACRA